MHEPAMDLEWISKEEIGRAGRIAGLGVNKTSDTRY
jgi:hypothetical protein